MRTTILYVAILIFLLLAGSACGSQPAAPAQTAATPAAPVETATAPAAPPATVEPASTVAALAATPTAAATEEAEVALPADPAGTDEAGDENALLIWEGNPAPGAPNAAACLGLRIGADNKASVGPCGAVNTPVEGFAGRNTEWTDILARFAPFATETDSGRIVFRGRGDITSPAWRQAIATWASFTAMELSAGRVSAAGRTAVSWWLGEVPGQAGACRHLIVLAYGYAYTNITPCEGGQSQQLSAGWLETPEMDQFAAWRNNSAPIYEGNSYFDGTGTTELSPAEKADLAAWADRVYGRLVSQGAAPAGAGAAAGCPEAAPGTQVLANPDHGYCLAYPAGYQVEKPNPNEVVLVVGSLLNVTDPRLHIEVTDAAGQTTAEAADKVAADYALPAMETERGQVTLGGEEAVVLDKLPGQDINRRVVLVHDGRLYNLMFSPASPDAGDVYTRMEEMYDLVTKTFTFIK